MKYKDVLWDIPNRAMHSDITVLTLCVLLSSTENEMTLCINLQGQRKMQLFFLLTLKGETNAH